MEYIKCVDREWGAEITVYRPEALNALNMDVLNELDETLSRLEKEGSARVLVLTGAGEKAFAAGADIAAMRDMTPQEAMAFSARGQAVMEHLEHMPAVVLAAVSGYALGGGCELALAWRHPHCLSHGSTGNPGSVPGRDPRVWRERSGCRVSWV